jgi:hypothetical protein
MLKVILIINIFIKGFMTDEEFEALVKVLKIDHGKVTSDSHCNKARISQLFFDKSYFIIKILKASIEKLIDTDSKALAKGLEWVTYEMHDSLLLKSDDRTLMKMEKMKEGNKELETIFSWLEEYSTIKHKQKENIDTVLQKLYTSNSFNEKSGDITFCLETPKNSIKTMGNSNFLDFSEECISQIEEPTFDIFRLENEVGKENTLSTVSCYIFISLGLYSIINYNNFENFLQEVTKGYMRTNPYHNV